MRFAAIAACVPLLAFAAPAQADIVEASDHGFVTRDEALVDATPMEVWLALISPGKWWNDGHTWSGDAANMTLKPQAGGCFCERIPEDSQAAHVTLAGSVEHMRVIHAYPERALRLRGALGPLQSEAADGVLTITIGQIDGGTRIVWEYVVGGYMRYDIPVIAPAVDGVMSEQLNGLANLLGRVALPETEAESEPEVEPEPQTAPDPASEPEQVVVEAPAQSEPEAVEEERELTLEEAIDALADN